jgi:molybdopterin biosynthesis enzyme
LSVLAAANGLVIHPAGAGAMAAGEDIQAIFF